METKTCHKCGRTLKLSEFSTDKHQYDGKACYCKECLSKRHKFYKALQLQGRKVSLAKATTADLINELQFRLNQQSCG